ncbi:MAG TPA: hypothetical protein PK239_04555 [Chitinophagales bacterium]|nr:hypothetical protein [Chitinophagales bacterium]HRK26544.1 hypothetical protein [Chitinophagales bacterium]
MKHNGNSLIIIVLMCFLLLTLNACKKDPPQVSCEGTMFGTPIAATGLDATKCKPTCACKNFTATTFTLSQLEQLKTWVLTTPFNELTENPYNQPLSDADSAVCAVVIENMATRLYRLQNFNNPDAAKAAGAILTHYDACGLCSTLADFTVYAGNLDVGTPVRQCALANFAKPLDSLVACIQALGFTKPCAQIWAYNARNTQALCLQPCLSASAAVYHNTDGTLNECLECDEQLSGPVFKAVAGRTRRNTGIASSICRFCDEVQPVKHNYPF